MNFGFEITKLSVASVPECWVNTSKRFARDADTSWPCHCVNKILAISYLYIPNIIVILCSITFLRDYYFADWRLSVVRGNKFLRHELTEISAES